MSGDVLDWLLDTTVMQRVLLFILSGVLTGIAALIQFKQSVATTALLYYLGCVVTVTLLLYAFVQAFTSISLWDAFLAETSGALITSVGLVIVALTRLYPPLFLIGVVALLLALVYGCAVVARVVIETCDVSRIEGMVAVASVKLVVFATYAVAVLVSVLFASGRQGMPVQ